MFDPDSASDAYFDSLRIAEPDPGTDAYAEWQSARYHAELAADAPGIAHTIGDAIRRAFPGLPVYVGLPDGQHRDASDGDSHGPNHTSGHVNVVPHKRR